MIMTIFGCIGLYGAYKRIGDAVNPAEAILQGFSIIFMAVMCISGIFC